MLAKKVDRRDFLKAATVAGASLLVDQAVVAAPGAEVTTPPKLRGVNLGGWLVLEKWITPGLYAGVEAEDEYTLCEKLGRQRAAERLERHRETWITAEDFRWLAARGLNAVRLPVGYGVLEENPPFITAPEKLDWAFRTAKAHGLGVLLDLHGVPGSQNGWDHSGKAGALGWHTSEKNVAHTLRIVEALAEFCKPHDNLLGLESVNEPRFDIPLSFLQRYYEDAYARVRKHLSPERAAVVFHDGFRSLQWGDFMHGTDHRNVLLDTHLYQCFGEDDAKRDIHGQVELAVSDRKIELDMIRQRHRCIVGEWSCGLPRKSRPSGRFGLDAAMRAYGAAQLLTYDTTEGWFFWTYRTEKDAGWSFRECVERGWLPDKYSG